jgi:threonine synthase
MEYYSLNGHASKLSFREAVIQGQAPDKGLYFPAEIPLHSENFWKNISDLSDREIAYQIMAPYVGTDLDYDALMSVIGETLSFPLPVVTVASGVSVLELFHGPTLAFKDIGARFMSRCLGRFAAGLSQRIVVLVATSGDTGGAVANSFHGVPGVDVVVLYPSGKVSPVQERQIAALGGNVHALEVSGDFDDCQALVKQAFTDAELRKSVYLTSANSINVARWLPQQLYYALAWKQWAAKDSPPVCVVPSGNFGNIGAGLLLQRSGLPVKKFVAACNANDVIPHYLESGTYLRRPSTPTLSNAMDVADPSNFVRIEKLFGNDLAELKKHVQATRTSDESTRAVISRVYKEYGYVADPHTAVAWDGWEQVREEGEEAILLSTAHPVKFPTVVEEETGHSIAYPETIKHLWDNPLQQKKMEAKYEPLREVLMDLA